jgi:hypothetical protein
MNIKRFIVEALGGYYPPVDKHDILDERVASLFHTIRKNELLRQENGVWYSGDRELTEHEIRQIKAEARVLLNSRLWQVLEQDIEYQSYRTIFTKSRTEIDLIGGKMLKVYLDIHKTRLQELSA